MDDNDLIFLNKSLNNDNNESINNLTSDIIKTTKQNILSELPITKKYNSELTKKLKN